MEPFTERTQDTHQIYPSENGLSYTITGKDGKREGFIKYDSVESVYVESISRQSRFTFVWLAMLVVLIFIAMAALDGFFIKIIALCVFSLMGSFLLFDQYSQGQKQTKRPTWQCCRNGIFRGLCSSVDVASYATPGCCREILGCNRRG